MYTLIVVPLDGSPFGERALPLALRIARHTGASLELVHVHEPGVVAGLAARVDRRLEQDAKEGMREALDALRDRVAAKSGLPVTMSLLEGEIVPALQEHIESRGADLVVMTTHGRGGVSRAWLGSVADALVRRVGVPVLLARQRTVGRGGVKAPPVRRVLVPLDGSQLAEEALTPAVRLSTPFRTEYLLLRVVSPIPNAAPRQPGADAVVDVDDVERQEREAAQYLAAVADQIRRPGVPVNALVVVQTQPARAILDVARERGVDLIALATRGHGALGRLLLGSVADKVIRGAAVPTLVYRPPTAAAARDTLGVVDTVAAQSAGRAPTPAADEDARRL